MACIGEQGGMGLVGAVRGGDLASLADLVVTKARRHLADSPGSTFGWLTKKDLRHLSEA